MSLPAGVKAQLDAMFQHLFAECEALIRREVPKQFGQIFRGGKIDGAHVTTFLASGASHAVGAVPDPGSSAGSAKFLREDATWANPAGAFGWTAKTANYTITPADSGVLIDATSNDVTITLPSAVGVTQPFAVARKDSSAHVATINTTSSQHIGPGYLTASLSVAGESLEFGSDGANWWIKAGYYPSPLTSKGDLVVADANALPQRLGVGANAKVLTADSTKPTGEDWE